MLMHYLLICVGLWVLGSCASATRAEWDQEGAESRVVATVLGSEISVEDLESAPLSQRILSSLLHEYRIENVIEASKEDVQECIESIFDHDDESEGGVLSDRRRLAVRLVLDWQTDRRLYEEYGGVVIFQQINPREPVGAYHMFLREKEEVGCFIIHDKDCASQFWKYFTRDHGAWVVDPSKVDYSIPWWRQVRKGL